MASKVASNAKNPTNRQSGDTSHTMRPWFSMPRRNAAKRLFPMHAAEQRASVVVHGTYLMTLVVITACGGSVAEGTSNPGGSTARGGTTALGGQGYGGSHLGYGGATSTRETLPDACTQPQDRGSCDAVIPAYWHDPKVGVCRPYLYGGCDGNENRFKSLSECQKTCKGVVDGGEEYDRCSSTSDCTLTASSCCSSCDPVEQNAFVSVRRDAETAFRAYSGCSEVLCEPCLEVAPTQRTSRLFYAACDSGQCTVRDLRENALTVCNRASDCMLRCGTGCCESCSGNTVVALRTDTDAVAEFCGGVPLPCPNCDCAIATGTTVDCRDGRCVVTGEAVCTVGMDQTCNDDPIMSSLAGICNADGTCSCHPGRTYVSTSGRCR